MVENKKGSIVVSDDSRKATVLLRLGKVEARGNSSTRKKGGSDARTAHV